MENPATTQETATPSNDTQAVKDVEGVGKNVEKQKIFLISTNQRLVSSD